MRVKWTHAALSDLNNIANYIRRFNPQAANDVKKRIVLATLNLSQSPAIGRPTKRPGYRLLVVSNLPYLLGYRIYDDYVEIGSVIDGRMDRAPDLF